MTRIISKKDIFVDKYFNLVENTVDFGSGLVRKHVDIYRKPAVSVFPINSSYEIFLIKQYRYLLKEEVIEAVAGIIDEGESILEAARRELSEEVGIVAKNIKELKNVSIAGSFIKINQHLILARDLTFGDSAPEETEEIEMIKMSLDEAVEKVLSGEIYTSSSMLGILILDKMRQRGEI